MKIKFQIFIALAFVSAMLQLSACGPAQTTPKLETKSAEPQAQQTPPPVVQQPPIATPVEEPRPQVVAKPKREPAIKSATSQKSSPPRPTVNTPAPSATPVSDTASAGDRTLTLPAPVAPPIAIPAPPPDEVKREPVEPPPPRQITIPSGTLVAVRMIDSIDSETAHAGETFKASLDAPIVVDSETVFPTGSEVYVKLAKVESAGRVSGRSELQVQLDRIFLGKTSYTVESNIYTNTGASQGARTAKTAGLGAVIGAAIGAISGGGKGAVIGATTGAGAGAGVEAIRKGEQVRVDSETRLDFRLEDSVKVTLQSPSSSTTQRNNPSGPVRFGTRQ